VWLSYYKLSINKLLIIFGPYDMVADTEVELEQLSIKNNPNATKFFVEFY